MSKAGYSGGNWSVLAPEGEHGYHVVSIGDNTEWSDVTFYGVRARDNAHLFKSAPDMYETLKTIVDCSTVKAIDLGDGMTIDIESIKELLAKARGEL